MAGTLTFAESFSHTSVGQSVAVTASTGNTLATAGDLHTAGNYTTSATPNTWTAIEMGLVSPGSAHWVYLSNLSSTDEIIVAYDDDDTDILQTLVVGGPDFRLRANSQVYVKCTAAASVPYLAIVNEV